MADSYWAGSYWGSSSWASGYWGEPPAGGGPIASSLLDAGYWIPRFWCKGYWQTGPQYWPVYGSVVVPPVAVVAPAGWSKKRPHYLRRHRLPVGVLLAVESYLEMKLDELQDE